MQSVSGFFRGRHGFIAINLLNADFSAYQQLSAGDLLPVIVIALVSFLIKAGGLSLIGKNAGMDLEKSKPRL